MAVRVRPATGADVHDLAALSEAAFRRAYEGLLDASTVDAVVTQVCTPTSFLDLIGHVEGTNGLDRLLVATEGGRLLGFLDFATEPDGLELRRLYTRVGDTGKGVGAALLAALEDGLPAGTEYRIVVVAENVRGLRFWERHGFRVRSHVDGIDHFRMHRGVTFPEAAPTARLLVLHRTTVAT